MNKKSFFNLGIGIIFLIISGCCTIIHGTTQKVSFSSNPSKAQVTINGLSFGTTPLSILLSRKAEQIIKIELEGYSPYEIILIKKVDAWIAGNIIFGGLIGLAVDAISGAMYKLSPEQIQAELRKETGQIIKDDKIYLFVTLVPKAEWEKIDNLIRQN